MNTIPATYLWRQIVRGSDGGGSEVLPGGEHPRYAEDPNLDEVSLGQEDVLGL